MAIDSDDFEVLSCLIAARIQRNLSDRKGFECFSDLSEEDYQELMNSLSDDVLKLLRDANCP